MTYRVITLFTVKTKKGDLTLNPGQTVTLAEEKAAKLIEGGKISPIFAPEDNLNERCGIQGENCALEETKPYISTFDTLIIPWNSDKKYHYWAGGQSICVTLRELGRCDLIPKYRSIYN